MDVPLTCGLLTNREVRITSDSSAVGLVEKMNNGRLTVEEVVTTLCKRAAVAHQLTTASRR